MAASFILQKSSDFQELGLTEGTPVGTSLIDAHAGGVGVMASVIESTSGDRGY